MSNNNNNNNKKTNNKTNNSNITNEDLIGLHHVNVNALFKNFLVHGQGSRNTSPNIRSTRLDNLPKIDMINKSYVDEEPVYVPKLKLPPLPKQNNSKKSLKRKRSNTSTKSSKSSKSSKSNKSNKSKKGGSLTRSKGKRT